MSNEIQKFTDDELNNQINKSLANSMNLINQKIDRVIANQEKQDKKIDGKVDKSVYESDKFNNPLFGIESEELQADVRRAAVKALGGYKSPAYNNNSIRGKTFSDVQNQLKREFDVKRYKAIKRKDLPKAKQILKTYELPMVLRQQIIALNNQVSVEEVI